MEESARDAIQNKLMTQLDKLSFITHIGIMASDNENYDLKVEVILNDKNSSYYRTVSTYVNPKDELILDSVTHCFRLALEHYLRTKPEESNGQE